MNNPGKFERDLLEHMIAKSVSLRQALIDQFEMNKVDQDSVIDLVDFLEDMVYDLDKVSFLMQVYTKQIPDFELFRESDNEKKDLGK